MVSVLPGRRTGPVLGSASHSAWAFPYSVAVVGLGASRRKPGSFRLYWLTDDGPGLDRRTLGRGLLATGGLVFLVNLPCW